MQVLRLIFWVPQSDYENDLFLILVLKVKTCFIGFWMYVALQKYSNLLKVIRFIWVTNYTYTDCFCQYFILQTNVLLKLFDC